jgi:pyrimidine operon attenuation protein / uracil phosphoribosyltransferase
MLEYANTSQVNHYLDSLVDAIRQIPNFADYQLIGIRTGGIWVAEALQKKIPELSSPLGVLDISFYRDDFSRHGLNPEVKPSLLPFEVDNQSVLLVDDVLFTGRTIRAALNEIFDYGRPACVKLAVLVDRGCRELPITPDVCGVNVDLKTNQHLKLTGPDSLKLLLK